MSRRIGDEYVSLEEHTMVRIFLIYEKTKFKKHGSAPLPPKSYPFYSSQRLFK